MATAATAPRARGSVAGRAATAGKPAAGFHFLPPKVREAALRLLRRSQGALMLAAAIGLAAALVTYAPTDPSFNTAAPGHALNALGLPGALVADVLIQTFGLASLVPVLTLLAWGIRLMIAARIDWVWLRILATVAASLLAALALTPFAGLVPWPLPSGIAGAGGTLLLVEGQRAVIICGLPPALRWVLPVVGGGIGAALLLWASALRRGDIGTVAVRGATAARLARETGVQHAATASGIARVIVDPVKGFYTRLLQRALPADLEAAAPVHREPTFTRDLAHADLSHTDLSGREGTAEAGSQPLAAAPLAAPPGLDPPAAEPTAEAAPPRPLVTPPKAAPPRRDLPLRQTSLLPDESGAFSLPPLDVLSPPPANANAGRPDAEALSENARMLESVLSDFGVNGRIVEVRPGPVVTLYELDPAPGTKTSRVVGLADDIARSMSAFSVRIAVVPGRSTIGIELPNARRQTVNFRNLLMADEFHRNHEKTGGGLTLALGLDIGGTPMYVDLARMPHLLIAGTTGSGKSVAVNTMICSLLYRLSPAECRFIMIDPKMLELSVYAGIPHLLAPVVTDSSKAVVALKWAVKEMENRYRHMSLMGVRNIAGYNQKLRDAATKGQVLTRSLQVGFDPDTDAPIFEEQPLDMTPLPFIVVIVDEMADLMLVAGKDVEAAIQRLAQMARAAGIHLIMATQRPSVDVITGTIKANFPTRVSFQVTSKIDSRTILGEQGAEQLLGQGDMLYMAAGGRITRVHGPFISDQEVEAIAAHLKAVGEPDYVSAVTDEDQQGSSSMLEAASGGGESEGGGTDLFDQAVALVARERKASTSFIQRHLQIGYNRAARIIEQMEKEGMVGKPNHVGKREVLLPSPDNEY